GGAHAPQHPEPVGGEEKEGDDPAHRSGQPRGSDAGIVDPGILERRNPTLVGHHAHGNPGPHTDRLPDGIDGSRINYILAEAYRLHLPVGDPLLDLAVGELLRALASYEKLDAEDEDEREDEVAEGEACPAVVHGATGHTALAAVGRTPAPLTTGCI